jgi:hypothetical protein
LYQHPEPSASARWLFGHVFGDAQGHMVTFTGRQARLERDDARQNELTQTRQRSFLYPAATEEAISYLIEESQQGRDAFYSVHLFREAGNRRASNAVGAMSCLWLDEDDGRLPDEGLKPTAIVCSSEGRRHLYWKLSRSLSAEWVVTMNRRIAAWADGDIGKAGLASVLRPPGTRNFKRYPRVDRVVGELTGVPPWDPEVVDEAIPLLPRSEDKPRFSTPYSGPTIELLDYLDCADVEVLSQVPDAGGVKFSIVCPWVHEHSGGDRTGTYVGQYPSGAPWFYCNHEHCQGRRWRDFRRQARPRGSVSLVPQAPEEPEGKVVIRLV